MSIARVVTCCGVLLLTGVARGQAPGAYLGVPTLDGFADVPLVRRPNPSVIGNRER